MHQIAVCLQLQTPRLPMFPINVVHPPTCEYRGSKLQKEQQKRRDAARLRIQREKRAKEAAARDQARIEEQIKARKLEQRRKEEEVGLTHTLLQALNTYFAPSASSAGVVRRVQQTHFRSTR